MGVITSVPQPIKLQIQDLGNSQSDTLVIDSEHFENKYEWTSKACLAIISNKRCKKVVFKLNSMTGKPSSLSKSLTKVLQITESLYFYGNSLKCFEDTCWETSWKTCKIESLAIKDKLTGPAFLNLCIGLSENTKLKELTLGSLTLSDISELNKSLKKNTSLKSLNILCDIRIVSDSSSNESLESSAPSTTHSIQGSSHLLSDNSGVSSYSLTNYIENCPYLVLGLIRNRSVKRLVLENLDIDRETLNIWSEMFRLNQNIKEIDIRRGFNTSAAMTIFASLKRNRKINLLKLQECTFGEAGFMLLQDLLRENQGLKKLEVKDLMRLRYNSETSNDMKNFLLIISGLTDNQSILEASVSIHSNHSNHSCVPQSFTPQVSKALQDLGKLNRWLVSLKIEGFKLSGNDICGLLIGLKENSVMKTCVLTSNLVEWKDLSYILTLVEELEVLMVLDLQDNKILTYTDLENLKGKFVASQSLAFMKESLLLLLKGLKCEVRISSWLFDPMCYPAEIQPIVKKSKNVH